MYLHINRICSSLLAICRRFRLHVQTQVITCMKIYFALALCAKKTTKNRRASKVIDSLHSEHNRLAKKCTQRTHDTCFTTNSIQKYYDSPIISSFLKAVSSKTLIVYSIYFSNLNNDNKKGNRFYKNTKNHIFQPMHIRPSREVRGAMHHHDRPRHTHRFLCVIQYCKEE